MFAGLLNEPIQICHFNTSKSYTGVITSEMSSYSYSTRAKVGHIGGSRSVINDEIEVPYTKNFVMRYYVPIDETCWIKYNNSYWRVTSIDKDREKQHQVVITELVQE